MNEINNEICLDHPSIFNNITLIYWQHWDLPTLVQNSLYHLKGLFLLQNNYIFYVFYSMKRCEMVG